MTKILAKILAMIMAMIMAVPIAEVGSKGCSVEGTDAAPRAHGPGALWSQPVSAEGNNTKSNRFAILFVLFVLFF